MRAVLRPRGTAPVVNMSAHSQHMFFDSDHVSEAIDTAQRRIHNDQLRAQADELAPRLKRLATFEFPEAEIFTETERSEDPAP